MVRILLGSELEKLHSSDLTIFGTGSSCVEFLDYIYMKRIKPNKITLVDSFKNGTLESPFGNLDITKMNPQIEFLGKLIIASCHWHSILNYWTSHLPNDFFILSNELIHLANALSFIEPFQLSQEIINKIDNERIRDIFHDSKSKELFDLAIHLRAGKSEELFNEKMLDLLKNNVEHRSKYQELSRLSDFDLIIDGGIFDGGEILDLSKLLDEQRGQYYGFDPELGGIKKEIIEIVRSDPKVKLIDRCLWDSQIPLFFTPKLGGSSVLTTTESPERGNSKLVKTEVIDDYFASIKGTRCLVKLDIEGAELRALRGGTNFFMDNKMFFAISMYHRASDLLEIPKFLMSLGKKFKYHIEVSNPTFIDWVLYAIED